MAWGGVGGVGGVGGPKNEAVSPVESGGAAKLRSGS